ncbi:MAG: hypothetical protein HFE98_01680 [Ruminiclostridium sp.]|nr:hypothetical protein [Ruminiclostridium sp.]
MSYFKVCPHCGAHLDPGEVCDCRDNEEAPASAANAGEGKVEKGLTDQISTSHDTGNQGGLQDESKRK